MVFQIISIPHPCPLKDFGLDPTPQPHWKFQLSFILSLLKTLDFETPPPPGISNNLPWGRYGSVFWNHTIKLLETQKCLKSLYFGLNWTKPFVQFTRGQDYMIFSLPISLCAALGKGEPIIKTCLAEKMGFTVFAINTHLSKSI